MKYKITKQYAHDNEKLTAEFRHVEDANFFIERKSMSDAEQKIKLIYRLFNDQQLIKEFNKEKINSIIRPGEYAEGDTYLPDNFGRYKISKTNFANEAHAAFVELNDAELFVEDKLTLTSDIVTYFIFNNDTIISEMNQRVKKQIEPKDTQGGQGKGQNASFRPTPFNLAPRPLGVPPSSFKDEKEEKK